MVTPYGCWYLNFLRPFLGDGVQRFVAEVVPRDRLGENHIRWLSKGSGVFSIKTAYKLINKSYPSNVIFKAIWKLKVSEKVRLFI